MKSKVPKQLILVALACIAAFTPSVPATATHPASGAWLAGDFHVHTIWGHDTCITPTQRWDDSNPDRTARTSCTEPWTWGFAVDERINDAEMRGLDFVALTDHNNVLWQTDPFVLGYTGPVTLVPGYENSMPGHVQMIGARSCYDNYGPVSNPVIGCNGAVTDKSAAGMTNLANALRNNGGSFQVNHPSDHGWESRFGYSVVPDTVEVWNIGPWLYQPPFPASNDNDFSLNWWNGFLTRGYHVAATGGSDSHWRLTSTEQGIGQPTTWVFAEHNTPADIIAGLRAGRTIVSAQPPLRGSKVAYIEADSDNDGIFESMIGDTVPSGAKFRVTSNADPGSTMRIVTDTGYLETALNGLGSYDITDQVASLFAKKFVRIEIASQDAQSARLTVCDPLLRQTGSTHCRNRLFMQTLTSPIYLSS